ncbi:universal stress protein [Maribacter chungangensis]|uniref:Universal stress protein n=1 Tax=Maribacter chungangensis TaxID=1069117 RepID=A0ABW3B5S8_9FLAO
MKNILVATDFSNNAYASLFYATKLFKSEVCTFYLLNTYNEFTPIQGKTGGLLGRKKHLEHVKKESETRLNETSHRIVLDNSNDLHHFETRSAEGSLIKIIKEEIAQKKIDFIVMGNKGFTQTADVFFGSNTIQVVQALNSCPVFAIPGEMDFKAPKDIAFVTDYKTGCHPSTLAPLLFVASLSNAAIHVMHINERQHLSAEQENNRILLEECLANVEHSFHNMYDFDDKAKVIETFLDTMKIDLYAMVNRKKSLFERLSREPVIKDVSMYSDVPFLILPDESEK